MFVRTRKLKCQHGILLTLTLTESERDRDRVRQLSIKYITSLREIDKYNFYILKEFWEKIDYFFADALFTDEEKQKFHKQINKNIGKFVPRPRRVPRSS